MTVLYVRSDAMREEERVGMTDRRAQIAEAGIAILASRGVRALTHLAIDRELGLPDGSTSYYARTRRDLIAVIVDRLATRTGSDLTSQALPEALTPAAVASVIVAGLDATMRRADEHRARLILLLECRSDPELEASLATRPEVRGAFVDAIAALLVGLDVDRPQENAQDAAALLDGLLMQRVIRASPAHEEAILTAYLTGLTDGRGEPLGG